VNNLPPGAISPSAGSRLPEHELMVELACDGE
jgi:hypothetical protein